MQRKNWTQEQIIGLLRQAEQGDSTIAGLCRAQGVSENTFYKWRQKYGSLQVNEARSQAAARTRSRKRLPQEALGGRHGGRHAG